MLLTSIDKLIITALKFDPYIYRSLTNDKDFTIELFMMMEFLVGEYYDGNSNEKIDLLYLTECQPQIDPHLGLWKRPEFLPPHVKVHLISADYSNKYADYMHGKKNLTIGVSLTKPFLPSNIILGCY